jgi:hypothetical protein
MALVLFEARGRCNSLPQHIAAFPCTENAAEPIKVIIDTCRSLSISEA